MDGIPAEGIVGGIGDSDIQKDRSQCIRRHGWEWPVAVNPCDHVEIQALRIGVDALDSESVQQGIKDRVDQGKGSVGIGRIIDEISAEKAYSA